MDCLEALLRQRMYGTDEADTHMLDAQTAGGSGSGLYTFEDLLAAVQVKLCSCISNTSRNRSHGARRKPLTLGT